MARQADGWSRVRALHIVNATIHACSIQAAPAAHLCKQRGRLPPHTRRVHHAHGVCVPLQITSKLLDMPHMVDHVNAAAAETTAAPPPLRLCALASRVNRSLRG